MEVEKTLLEEHDTMIHENILPRLNTVESGLKKVSDEVGTIKTDLIGVKNGQKELELTVLKQGQINRELQEQSNNMITQLLGVVVGEKQSDEKIQIKKLDTKEKIIVALAGTGGLAGILAALAVLFK